MTTLTECGRRLKWTGGEHDFDLGSARALRVLRGDPLVALEFHLLSASKLFEGQYGDTPAACLKRFEQSVYSVDDVLHIIALGLYGGGMSAGNAVATATKNVTGRALAPNALIAYEVLAALFVGAANASA